MSPASRAEPVGTREEIRLEDRLQHQLQACLDHPVGDHGDPQPTQLATALPRNPPPCGPGTRAAPPLTPPPPASHPGRHPVSAVGALVFRRSPDAAKVAACDRSEV